MSEIKPFDPQKLVALRQEAAAWRRQHELLFVLDHIDKMSEPELRQVEARIALTRGARTQPEHVDL